MFVIYSLFEYLPWVNFVFQPYDFLALIPVIEGAGGVITDWKGHKLHWEASPLSVATSMCLLNIAPLKLCLISISFFGSFW